MKKTKKPNVCSTAVLRGFNLGDSRQFKPNDETNLNFIHADAAASFDAALQEINSKNGTIAFADVFRDSAMQERRYAAYLKGGPPASRPGRGSHEAGIAVDVYSPHVNDTVVAIFAKHGWHRTMMGRHIAKKSREPWHFEWHGFSRSAAATAQEYYRNCISK